MTRRWWIPLIVLLVLKPFVVTASADPKPVAFADARVIVEVNATDGDAGRRCSWTGSRGGTSRFSAPTGSRSSTSKQRDP